MADPIIYNGEVRGVRYGVGPFKWGKPRGLLRALQDLDHPCEPLVPPTGVPGEEGYNPGEVSELHHILPYLVYPPPPPLEPQPTPEPKKNRVPLPPRGGTFIMEKVSPPSDPEVAEDVFLANNRKILVTGGGGTPDYEAWDTASATPSLLINNWEYAIGVTYNICPPRMFAVGNAGDLPGWPWRDSAGVTRLVSVSARMVHVDETEQIWGRSDAEFLIEFLKPNGEPFAADDENRMEPIETTVTEGPPNTPSQWNGLEYPYWYDFSVMSITPRGNKAILALHQAAQQQYRGVPYDFVVLDLEAIGVDRVQYISRYDNYVNTYTGCSVTESGEISNVAAILENETYDEPTAATGIHWQRGKIKISAQPLAGIDPTIDPYPTSGTQSISALCEHTYAIVFNSEEKIVRKFLRVNQNRTYFGSQTLDTITGEDGESLYPFLAGIVQYYERAAWAVGDVCLAIGIHTVGYFVCMESHDTELGKHPFLINSGAVDGNPTYWLMVYGWLPYENRCWWARRNFTVVDSHNDLLPGQIGRPGSNVWMNTGEGIRVIFPGVTGVTPPNIVSFYELRQLLQTTLTTSYSGQLTFFSKVLPDGTEEEVNTLSYSGSYTQDTKKYRRSGTLSCSELRGWGELGDLTHIIRTAEDASTQTSSNTFAEMSVSGGQMPPMPDVNDTITHGVEYHKDQLFLRPNRYDIMVCPTVMEEGNGPAWLDGCNWQFLDLSVYVWPIYGTGIAFYPSVSASSSTTGGVEGTGSPTQSYAATKPGCILTHQSDIFDITVDEEPAIPLWSKGDPTSMELDKVRAVTDPAPYTYGGLPPNDGFVLEPLIGPEKGIACSTQNIAYVGWLRPDELKERVE